jgi:subtilisin family serine protease
VLVCLLAWCWAGAPLRAQTPEDSYALDSTLRLLRSLRNQKYVPANVRSALRPEGARVSIRLRHGTQAARVLRLEQDLGIELARSHGQMAHVGDVYAARVPWDALDRLAQRPEVERIDSTWKPAVLAPLDVSVPETRADRVWSLFDAAGWPLTGRGVVVANFDTGVDVFHPDLWREDGGTYPWLDVNGNQTFDPAVDAVDLNGDSKAAATERLSFVDSASPLDDDPVPGTNDHAFHPDTDWLYNDANGNGRRDYGLGSGFAEQDPTYGERLFLAQDANHNGQLDVGETLIALGSSKVQRLLGANAVEYARGVNLINSPPDVHSGGHGTQVASILCGGSIGLHRYVGVAPGINLLLADRYANDYATYIPWAEENGAQVMLYEYGSWIQEFLDGSSNLEQMLDAEAAKGIVQVAPAGNLADGRKHAHPILDSGRAVDLPFEVPSFSGIQEGWLSILWRAPDEAIRVELVTPAGESVALPGRDTWNSTQDGHHIWSGRDRSSRGTARFDVYLHRDGAVLSEGTWKLRLTNLTPGWLSVHAYVSDDLAGWSGGIAFAGNVADRMYTVTSPATADSAIAVASYSTRGRLAGVPDDLSSFSGQGPRIDNAPILDLAAPGHFDVACARSKDVPGAAFGQYAWFGGTSAAGPHVAAAAALVKQSDPSLGPLQIAQALQRGARQDAFTGVTPNERWGYGKLDVWAAIPPTPTPSPTPIARIWLPIVLK